MVNNPIFKVYCLLQVTSNMAIVEVGIVSGWTADKTLLRLHRDKNVTPSPLPSSNGKVQETSK